MSKQSNKGLQRFTDFENLKTTEDFIELQKKDNKSLLELLDWLQDRVNEDINNENPEERQLDKYFNRIEKLLPLLNVNKPEEEKQKATEYLKRERWYLNDSLIKNCINNTIRETGVLPANSYIQKKTGLSRVTIDKHLKENVKSHYREDDLQKFKLLNDLVISKLYRIGMNNDDTKALKLFIDLTGDPKKTVINNNYLQINNTRIDSLLIDQLPIETRNQIEALILNNRLI